MSTHWTQKGNLLTYLGKTDYKYVYKYKTTTQGRDGGIIYRTGYRKNNLSHGIIYPNDRLAALELDKFLLNNNREAINILKRKMNLVTEEQLKQIAYQKRITSWTADECPVCEYPIKYVFDKDGVRHDPGCTCSDQETARAIRYQPSSFKLLADWINSQTDSEKIKKIKQFWSL